MLLLQSADNILMGNVFLDEAEQETGVIFGGRLGEYKYYDMDQVIAAALDRAEQELNE